MKWLTSAIAACCMFLQPLDDVGDDDKNKTETRSGELNNLHPKVVQRDVDGWTCMRAVADTGAEKSACSRQVCPDREVLPTPSSKAGRNFTGADGGEIINEGEQYFPTCSPEGVWTVQRWNTAETHRPLLAISEECDKGNLAVFGSGGGALINLTTREVRHLPREGGTYVAEMWVPSRASEVAAAASANSGFARQGW